MTRILLYSDEPILAKGLESVLRQVEGFELLPTCGSVASLMEQMAARRSRPGPHGSHPGGHLRRPERNEARHDELARSCCGSTPFRPSWRSRPWAWACAAFCAKPCPPILQVKCLQKVQAGELWFEKALTDSFLCARRVALTQREGQLVSLLSQGLKNKEIATTLMISEGTVKVYLSRLFQKVGVKDRFELALFGLKNLTTGQLPVGEKGHRAGASAMPGLRSLVLEASPRARRRPEPVRTPPPCAPSPRATIDRGIRLPPCRVG